VSIKEGTSLKFMADSSATENEVFFMKQKIFGKSVVISSENPFI